MGNRSAVVVGISDVVFVQLIGEKEGGPEGVSIDMFAVGALLFNNKRSQKESERITTAIVQSATVREHLNFRGRMYWRAETHHDTSLEWENISEMC